MRLTIIDGKFIDLAYGENGLEADDTLYSAILVSLLTDRRALLDDKIPDDNGLPSPIPPNRRGWAGDALASPQGDRIGSRLWLLQREKVTEETRQRAITYTKEALEWLIEDGLAKTVTVDASWNAAEAIHGRLDITVHIYFVSGAFEEYDVSIKIGV